MGTPLVVWLAACLLGVHGFIPHNSIGEKDPYLTDAFLRDVVERMGRELNDAASTYMEYPGERHLGMMARNGKDLETEQMDYDAMVEGNPHPSLRDQEYQQHSSLWGHQYVAGGAGEGEQRLLPSGLVPNRPLVKTDAVLPAYCDPPNPCPVGYSEEQGCISEFENTASFSREYQQSQHCMCDGEHMFTCLPSDLPEVDNIAHLFNNDKKSQYHFESDNPFLAGERLPIAAKKGFDVSFYDEK